MRYVFITLIGGLAAIFLAPFVIRGAIWLKDKFQEMWAYTPPIEIPIKVASEEEEIKEELDATGEKTDDDNRRES
jgi:hypothetical protein